jgi:superoxide dismutase, Cu-Zn family
MRRLNLSIPALLLSILALPLLTGCGPRREDPVEQPAAATAPEQDPASAPMEAAKTATATLQGAPGDADFSGTVTFTQEAGGLRVVADLAGVDKAGKHGFHVHENGMCEHDFTTAGGHFNPAGVEHACPPTEPAHAGDLGNVEVSNGSGRAEMMTNLLTLDGPNSVVGKAIILHAGEDDCKTQPTGNSGDRLACGVVTMDGMKSMTTPETMSTDTMPPAQ